MTRRGADLWPSLGLTCVTLTPCRVIDGWFVEGALRGGSGLMTKGACDRRHWRRRVGRDSSAINAWEVLKALLQDVYGGCDGLRVEEVDRPNRRPGRCRPDSSNVASVNAADWHIMRGELKVAGSWTAKPSAGLVPPAARPARPTAPLACHNGWTQRR